MFILWCSRNLFFCKVFHFYAESNLNEIASKHILKNFFCCDQVELAIKLISVSTATYILLYIEACIVIQGKSKRIIANQDEASRILLVRSEVSTHSYRYIWKQR